MLLEPVDAYAKWPVIVMTSTSSTKVTCNVLRGIFARYGLLCVLVFDNRPRFKSTEFERFIKEYSIIHKFSPAYHPATNGQTEHLKRD